MVVRRSLNLDPGVDDVQCAIHDPQYHDEDHLHNRISRQLQHDAEIRNRYERDVNS